MSGSVTNSTGTAGIIKTGNGILCLTSGSNNYNGNTTISGGVLQENLPANSFLSLQGGVYEAVSGGTFSRSFGSSGGTFCFAGNGGGFSAYTSPLTVNIGGGSATLAWGTTVGTQIVGTLSFESSRSTSAVTFLNPINLNGGARTIQVADNPSSTADYAALPAVISDTVGGGSFGEGRCGHALPARVGIEHLFRHDYDPGDAGGGEDRRRAGHSRQRDAERDALRRGGLAA